MKKILFQLDTDPVPNTFATIVAYAGGADYCWRMNSARNDDATCIEVSIEGR